MKIICTKEEFAILVSRCAESTCCGDCMLFDICETANDNSTLIDICEIKEVGNPNESDD